MIVIKGRPMNSNIKILGNLKKRKISLQTHKTNIYNRITTSRCRDLRVNILKAYTQEIN